jgi:serine/threonine-protein kinase
MTDATRLTAALADRYVIERELGAGGMATVYLAHDVRHDRKVALKVLRPELSAILGGERFLHEIKTTANLQHPHILSLFDSGEADGLVYYVMPYVEGESLRDRLTREKQLPVDEAVRIAREVADALEYAHHHGIVHRDIKPENILLHGGHAMVADFGIALAASRSEGGARMTETGMSLGTPHYMSPEQAMGEREITPKADIYALGCVLYEMLTAEPPFTGATAQAIIARVMTEEPRSLTLQRKTIPPHVEAAVVTALAKLPADRFASAAQFAEALGKTDYAMPATRAGTAASRAVARPTATQRVLRGVPWLFAAAGIGTSAWLVTHRPRPVAPPAERFTLSFGRGAAAADATGSPIAVSPDGSRIVYVGLDSAGARRLFLRSLDRVDPVPIPGTLEAIQPFFSPDGQWLGFQQDGKLRKVALAGGAVVTICDAGGLFGASWGTGDVIVFSQSGRLRLVSAAGGQPTDLAVPDSARGELYRFPEFLPDARSAVFTAVTDSGPSLRAVTLADSLVKPLGQRGMSPHYVEGGYLVYAEQDGTLFAAPFDVRALRLIGAPQPITDNVRLGPAQVAKLGVARTGSLAYLAGTATQSELTLVDRDGRVQSLPSAPNRYAGPRFSPDGRRIAVTIQELGRRQSGGVLGDLWVWDLGARNFQRITFDTASAYAEWMPDGRRLVYGRASGSGVIALYRILTDGSGQPESLLARPSPIFESSPTPDGRSLVFRESHARTGRDIWIAPLDSPQSARSLLVTPFDERNPAVSPDDRWLAYASNETGAPEIYVRGLAEGGGRTRVSTGGGTEPRWARSGRELFFRTADSVYVVTVTPGPEFRGGAPRALLGGRFTTSTVTNWDVAPDGRGFVMVRTPESALEGTPLNVVLHWFDRLRSQRR